MPKPIFIDVSNAHLCYQVGDSPEAYFLRHRHDKEFAEIEQQQRLTDTVVTLVQLWWRLTVIVFNAFLLASEGLSGGTPLMAATVSVTESARAHSDI